jgi:hypothetical protein
MPNEYPLALRQADEARADFAVIEEHLESNGVPQAADFLHRKQQTAAWPRGDEPASSPTDTPVDVAGGVV